jgi:chromosome segregation ATPase
LKEEHQEKESSFSSLSEKVKDKEELENKVESLSSQLEEKEKEISSLREELSSFEEKMASGSNKFTEDTKKYEGIVEEKAKEIEELKKTVEEKDSKISQQLETLEKAKNAYRSMYNDKNELDKKITMNEKTIADLTEEKQRLEVNYPILSFV